MSDKCTERNRLCVGAAFDFEKDWCMARSPSDGLKWRCSRKPGHSGDHVACSPGSNSHNLVIWPQEEKKAAPKGTKPTNPKDAVGSDKLPLHLWPTTASAMGCLGMLNGMLKYGRSNFRAVGVRSSIYYDAARRHLDAWFEGEECDPEDGVPHLSAALSCLAIIVDAQATGKLNDDRMTPGGYRKLVTEITPHVKRLKELHKARSPKHYTKES